MDSSPRPKKRPFQGISEATKLEIENALSDAQSDEVANPTSLYNTLKGRNNTRKNRKKRSEMNTSSRQKAMSFEKDPDLPIKPRNKRVPLLGDEAQNQIARGGAGYKGNISRQLGTSEMPVGKAIKDSDKSLLAPKGQDTNSTQYFSKGGDVRYNSKRGRTY